MHQVSIAIQGVNTVMPVTTFVGEMAGASGGR
jgi:hypothetical protein